MKFSFSFDMDSPSILFDCAMIHHDSALGCMLALSMHQDGQLAPPIKCLKSFPFKSKYLKLKYPTIIGFQV